MNGLTSRAQSWLVWLLPFVVIAAVIAWEVDWGRKWRHVPATDTAAVPQPVVVAVLPEYQPVATLATQRDFVDRTLFNPTRRPAPVAVAEAAKKRLQPGQFVLTGTMIIDGKATAFLRENAGGKSRRVAIGEQINGMLVSDVKPDRVKLTLGEESEDLLLKIAVGPKTTTQPVAAPPAGAQGAGGGAAPAGQTSTAAGGAAPAGPTSTDTTSLVERRRAARAAAAAAAAAASGVPAPLNAPPPGAYIPPGGVAPAAAPIDPRWGEAAGRVRARQQGQATTPGQ